MAPGLCTRATHPTRQTSRSSHAPSPVALRSRRTTTGSSSAGLRLSARLIDFNPDLRDRLQAALSAHERREHALEGRRHAAVAVVLVDSDAKRHDVDPLTPGSIDMSF